MLEALKEIEASPYFSNSKRYPTVLRYLVEQALLGRADEIKERTIGIEVFGRSPNYDTNIDTVVRYTAGEIRKRLALHYHEVEAPIQINLSARSYSVEFLRLVDVVADSPTQESRESKATPAQPYVEERAPATTPRRRTWILVVTSVLLLVLIGIRSWNEAHTDAVSRFWAPVLDQKIPTIISLGGLPFPLQSDGGDVASDDGSGNPYLSFETGLAMGRVTALLKGDGGGYRVQSAASTTVAQIRENPTVLVGGYNNEWTCRLTGSLRFHFADPPAKSIVDSRDASRSWTRDRSKPFGDAPDYALLARFRNPSTDSIVIVIAGLQRFGTDAASQFATSEDLLQQLDRQVGRSWSHKNIEIVLRVDAVKGKTAAPVIVATDVW